MIRIIRTTIAVFCVLLACIDSAWAYLDPGTGSLIVQGLIAGFAGLLVAGRLYWAKWKSFLETKLSKRADQSDDGDALDHASEDRDTE